MYVRIWLLGKLRGISLEGITVTITFLNVFILGFRLALPSCHFASESSWLPAPIIASSQCETFVRAFSLSVFMPRSSDTREKRLVMFFNVSIRNTAGEYRYMYAYTYIYISRRYAPRSLFSGCVQSSGRYRRAYGFPIYFKRKMFAVRYGILLRGGRRIKKKKKERRKKKKK